MEYYNYTMDDWKRTVISVMNQLLKKYNINIDESLLDSPITGNVIKFSSNDLYELYHILSRKVNKPIEITSYKDFYTMNNIAQTLYYNFN